LTGERKGKERKRERERKRKKKRKYAIRGGLNKEAKEAEPKKKRAP